MAWTTPRTTGWNPADPRDYVDTTGCGNSLNAGNPLTLQLIMDSLRYWVTEMHVDGFRFDLAPTLARQEGEFDQLSAFFDLVAQDPVVSRAKLIAEPWDVGQCDSYDLGRFPARWREWNGKYRDTHARLLAQPRRSAARRVRHPVLRARPTCTAARGAGPTASVNLITVHDGFTLRDLVSYDAKHNEANGEDNRDGTDDNRSWNCGAEGPTDDPDVAGPARAPVPRDAAPRCCCPSASRCCSAATSWAAPSRATTTPTARTTRSPGSTGPRADAELLAFTRRLIAFRRAHPVFRRRRFLTGADAARAAAGSPRPGTAMTAGRLGRPAAHSPWPSTSTASDDPDRADDGTLLLDDDFLVLVNAWWEPLDFVLPVTRQNAAWRIAIDTYAPAVASGSAAAPRAAGDHVTVGPRSIAVLSDPGRN